MTGLQPIPGVPAAPPAPQVAGDLAWRDLAAAMHAGWRDFLAMPRFGLFFGGVYVLTGIAIGWATLGAPCTATWTRCSKPICAA